MLHFCLHPNAVHKKKEPISPEIPWINVFLICGISATNNQLWFNRHTDEQDERRWARQCVKKIRRLELIISVLRFKGLDSLRVNFSEFLKHGSLLLLQNVICDKDLLQTLQHFYSKGMRHIVAWKADVEDWWISSKTCLSAVCQMRPVLSLFFPTRPVIPLIFFLGGTTKKTYNQCWGNFSLRLFHMCRRCDMGWNW